MRLRTIKVCLVFVGLLLASCRTTFETRLGKPEVERIVNSELQSVSELDVRSDFVRWSVAHIANCPAPAIEDLRGDLMRGYHRFVRAIIPFAKKKGQTFLSARTGRQFLRSSDAPCGVRPCNRRRCCDYCRRPCT
jgi:hypothetical protein